MNNLPSLAIQTDLDPIIITAPTIRAGTTLLQRLVCSSPRGLIFGELVGQDLEFALNLYTFKAQAYAYQRDLLARNLQQTLAGNVNEWIPDLMPDIDGYLNALGQGTYSSTRFCRDYAQRLGRPAWGFKYPGWKPSFIQLLRNWMPQARFIAITRDLGACAKSAKAQHVFNSSQDLPEFCRAWAEGVEYWNSVKDDPRSLVLSFEELTAEPDATFRRLAEFTGLDDMQPSVLQRKINTWTGNDSFFQAPTGYAQPAALTEAEQQLVDETQARIQARAYALA